MIPSVEYATICILNTSADGGFGLLLWHLFLLRRYRHLSNGDRVSSHLILLFPWMLSLQCAALQLMFWIRASHRSIPWPISEKTWSRFRQNRTRADFCLLFLCFQGTLNFPSSKSRKLSHVSSSSDKIADISYTLPAIVRSKNQTITWCSWSTRM